MMVSSKFFIVLIILLGIGFAYADDESANGSIGQFFRNLPRTNAAKTFNPQDPKYIEGITLLGLPFFILSLISVVFWILIFCCCKPARTVHSSSFLQCSRFLIISLCVLICGFALWGVASNSSIHNHENSLFDPLLTAQGDTMNKIEVLDTYIAAVNVTGNTATQLENVLKEINTTYIQLQSAKNFTEKYEKSREIAIGVLLSYTVVITVVTTFSMMCLYKLGLRLTIFFALLCLPSLMVLTGISLPVTVLVSDGCPNIQTLMTDNSKSSDGAIWINYYITCSGTNPLANVTDYANKKLNQTEYELEQAIKYHDANAIAQLNKTIGEIKQAIIALDNLSDCSGTKEAWDKTYSTACTTIFDDIAVIFFVSFSLIFLLSVLIGAEFLLYSKSTKFASSSSNGYEPLKNFEE